jgi:hypothetical protein
MFMNASSGILKELTLQVTAKDIYAQVIHQLQLAVHQVTQNCTPLEESSSIGNNLDAMLELAFDDECAGCFNMASKRYQAIVGCFSTSAQVKHFPAIANLERLKLHRPCLHRTLLIPKYNIAATQQCMMPASVTFLLLLLRAYPL